MEIIDKIKTFFWKGARKKDPVLEEIISERQKLFTYTKSGRLKRKYKAENKARSIQAKIRKTWKRRKK